MSILGSAYFDVIPTSVAYFMLVQENELFPAVRATVLYAGVLLENVSTQKLTTKCFCLDRDPGSMVRYHWGDSRVSVPRCAAVHPLCTPSRWCERKYSPLIVRTVNTSLAIFSSNQGCIYVGGCSVPPWTRPSCQHTRSGIVYLRLISVTFLITRFPTRTSSCTMLRQKNEDITWELG